MNDAMPTTALAPWIAVSLRQCLGDFAISGARRGTP